MHGYAGQIAIIDLSRKKIKSVKLSEKIYRLLIGGRGLAAYLFHHFIKPGIDPLSEENALIIATGPLNGTSVPLASKLGFFFKSPMTNAWGESYVGGSIPPALKWAGYDAIVVLGKSINPVYVSITDDGIKIEDAGDLWGKSVYDAEDELKEKYGKRAIIASIGQAGENLVRFAAIMNDKWRAAGRAGGGAVMGSKKLKAIVFSTARRFYQPAKSDEFKELIRVLLKKFRESEGVKRLRELGTAGMTIPANEMGFFPTRYWSEVSMENWENIGAYSVKNILLTPHACYNCPIACGRLVETDSRWGKLKLDGLEYETINTLGGQLLIDDLTAVTYLNDLADLYGMDTISLGNVIGFAIEAAKLGKIKRKIDYGNIDDMIELVKDIAFRREEGDILAEGVARASVKLGLENLAVHVKGLEPPAYDPRRLKGMILGLGTSPRGACHLRMMAYYVDLKGYGGGPESTSEEKVKKLVEFEDFMSAFDSLILCKFGRDVFDWETMTRILNSVTGFDLSVDDFKLTASRITTFVRLINSREGLRRDDDKLPKRLIDNDIVHMGQRYAINQGDVDRMLSYYYGERNFDDSGVPKKVLLEKLMISDLISIRPM